MEALILEFHKIEAVKFGSFKLKSGITSPIYINLRLIVSYPTLLSRIADLLFSAISYVAFDLVCGVPYIALPIIAILSVSRAVLMVMHRKEIKDHGTGHIVEGAFHPEQVCLVIEDLVTSSASILETATPLRTEGLEVCNAIVVIDHEQGGRENLAAQGIRLHALTTLSDILRVLVTHGRVSKEKAAEIRVFLDANRRVAIPAAVPLATPRARIRVSYGERAGMAKNPTGKRLFEVMEARSGRVLASFGAQQGREGGDMEGR